MIIEYAAPDFHKKICEGSCKSFDKVVYCVTELNKRFVFSGAMQRAKPTGAKMEAGESPARSRHCKERVLFSVPLLSGMSRRGKASKALMSKSGDMHRLR